MPKFSIAQYAKILFQTVSSTQKQDIPLVVNNFSEFVKKNQMMKKMPAILKSFVELVKKQEGEKHVSVISAFPLQNSIKKTINDMFGGKADIAVSEDKSLIGGMILKTENTIFDASIKTQLQKMKERI